MYRFRTDKSRVELTHEAVGGAFQKIAENITDTLVFLPIFWEISRYFLPIQPAHSCPIFFFNKKKHTMLFGNLILQAKIVFFSLAQKSWI